jgi:hypothetical protein
MFSLSGEQQAQPCSVSSCEPWQSIDLVQYYPLGCDFMLQTGLFACWISQPIVLFVVTTSSQIQYDSNKTLKGLLKSSFDVLILTIVCCCSPWIMLLLFNTLQFIFNWMRCRKWVALTKRRCSVSKAFGSCLCYYIAAQHDWNVLSILSYHLQITKPSLQKHVPIFGVLDVNRVKKFNGVAKCSDTLVMSLSYFETWCFR